MGRFRFSLNSFSSTDATLGHTPLNASKNLFRNIEFTMTIYNFMAFYFVSAFSMALKLCSADKMWRSLTMNKMLLRLWLRISRNNVVIGEKKNVNWNCEWRMAAAVAVERGRETFSPAEQRFCYFSVVLFFLFTENILGIHLYYCERFVQCPLLALANSSSFVRFIL